MRSVDGIVSLMAIAGAIALVTAIDRPIGISAGRLAAQAQQAVPLALLPHGRIPPGGSHVTHRS